MSKGLRIYLLGFTISSLGTWLFGMASNWLIEDLYDKSSGVALFYAVSGFAVIFCGTLSAGLIARFPRRTLLIIAIVAYCAISAALGWLAYSERITFGIMLWLAVALGIVHALRDPTEMGLIAELSENAYIRLRANRVRFGILFLLRIVIGLAGGYIIAHYGLHSAYWIDAATFFALIICLIFIPQSALDNARFLPRLGAGLKLQKGQPRSSVLTERVFAISHLWRDGFCYVIRNPPIRNILLVAFVVESFVAIAWVFTPGLVQDDLGGTPVTFGIILAGGGAGGLLAALFGSCSKTAFKATFIVAPLAALGIAFGPNMWVIAFCYGVILLVMTPFRTMLEQICQGDKQNAKVLATKSFLMRGSRPVLWLVIALTSEALDLGNRYGLATSVVLGTVLLYTVLTFAGAQLDKGLAVLDQ